MGWPAKWPQQPARASPPVQQSAPALPRSALPRAQDSAPQEQLAWPAARGWPEAQAGAQAMAATSRQHHRWEWRLERATAGQRPGMTDPPMIWYSRKLDLLYATRGWGCGYTDNLCYSGRATLLEDADTRFQKLFAKMKPFAENRTNHLLSAWSFTPAPPARMQVRRRLTPPAQVSSAVRRCPPPAPPGPPRAVAAMVTAAPADGTQCVRRQGAVCGLAQNRIDITRHDIGHTSAASGVI